MRVPRRSGYVVGDAVEVFGERLGLVPRRTQLLRRSPGGGIHVVAANLDLLAVVAAVDPPARAGLVDRAAVAARAGGIEPILVLNKIDLPSGNDVLREAEARVAGEFPVLAVSARSGAGLEALAACIARHGRAAFVGSSGVGKSSLMNQLAGIDLATRTLSQATGGGRHTTSVSTLHRLPTGGELVDTPGVREFGLVDVTPEDLARFFPGFCVVTDACRFRDCRHAEEPGCAIRAAVDDARIPMPRYIAYRTLLDELR